jgi:hypothetical protein
MMVLTLMLKSLKRLNGKLDRYQIVWFKFLLLGASGGSNSPPIQPARVVIPTINPAIIIAD